MKKLLLIIALTLLWSFSANAQLQTETKATKATKISETLPESSSPNCRTHYTAPEAYKSTADGNVNTFSATYSTVTQRTCERPANTPVSQGGAGCGAGNPECEVYAK